nr:MAG TPA: hypothetical protein [Siphoviridae sp. ctIwT7]
MFNNFGMVCRTAVMGVDNNYGHSKRVLFQQANRYRL